MELAGSTALAAMDQQWCQRRFGRTATRLRLEWSVNTSSACRDVHVLCLHSLHATCYSPSCWRLPGYCLAAWLLIATSAGLLTLLLSATESAAQPQVGWAPLTPPFDGKRDSVQRPSKTPDAAYSEVFIYVTGESPGLAKLE